MFPAGVEKALQDLSFLLVVPIVAFGPITGVVAAGLIYGICDSLCHFSPHILPLAKFRCEVCKVAAEHQIRLEIYHTSQGTTGTLVLHRTATGAALPPPTSVISSGQMKLCRAG